MPQFAPTAIRAQSRCRLLPSARLGASIASARISLAVVSLALSLFVIAGCNTTPTKGELEPRDVGPYPAIGAEVYRRAESERAERLSSQVARLRADLSQAEEALVTVESGLRGSHSRADAVSGLAGARISVERAASAAPWRLAELQEASDKLEEAERQVEDGHFGAALFFVYRAQRIADRLEAEASAVAAMQGARFISGRRVNLRAGPSTKAGVLTVLTKGTPIIPEDDDRGWVLIRTVGGAVGWVHSSLLSAP